MQTTAEEEISSTVAEAESMQVTYYVATSSYVEASVIAIAAVLFFLAFARHRRAVWFLLGAGCLLVFVGFLASITLYQLQPQGGVLSRFAPYFGLLGWGVILAGASLAFTRESATAPVIYSDTRYPSWPTRGNSSGGCRPVKN